MLISLTDVLRKMKLISSRVVSNIAWLLFVTSTASVSAHSQVAWKFEFGTGKALPGYMRVRASDFYGTVKGYGFEPGANVVCSARGGKSAAGFCSADRPFYFSASVPEGNYKVTITFGDKN